MLLPLIVFITQNINCSEGVNPMVRKHCNGGKWRRIHIRTSLLVLFLKSGRLQVGDNTQDGSPEEKKLKWSLTPSNRNLMRATSCLCTKRTREGNRKRYCWGELRRTKAKLKWIKRDNNAIARRQASDCRVGVSERSLISRMALLWTRSRRKSQIDDGPICTWLRSGFELCAVDELGWRNAWHGTEN